MITPETEVDRTVERMELEGYSLENNEDIENAFANLIQIPKEEMSPARKQFIKRIQNRLNKKNKKIMPSEKQTKKAKKVKHTFSIVGKTKEKTVYIREDRVKRKGKTIKVYRDRYGHFSKKYEPKK